MSQTNPAGLPTMQCNALRIILDKREFLPEEVARLDYQLLQRSPRIGRKGIGYIRNWLRQFGYDLANPPLPRPNSTRLRREKQLDKAVDLLRRNGFDVQLEALLGQPRPAGDGDR